MNNRTVLYIPANENTVMKPPPISILFLAPLSNSFPVPLSLYNNTFLPFLKKDSVLEL